MEKYDADTIKAHYELMNEKDAQEALREAAQQLDCLRSVLFGIPSTKRYGEGVADLRQKLFHIAIQLAALQEK